MIRQRQHRSGITMTEVLVTLFVMALGAIAILTLFPLGMLQMTLALKDDRTAQSASTADGHMRWYWKTHIVEPLGGPTDTMLFNAFDNPGSPLPPLGPGNADEASYPVAVDPIGWSVRSGAAQTWIAGGTIQTVPRRTLAMIPGNAAIRTCTMLDGLTYDTNGLPDTPNGTNIERDLRYNWLWILQRPHNKNPNIVTMDIVVFDKRGVYPTPENVFGGVALTPGLTALKLPFNAAVQKGMWIMDATNSGTVRHAFFYRVVSVTDDPGNPALVDVELDTPIRRVDGNANPYGGTIVVLVGIAEVFHRPMLVP